MSDSTENTRWEPTGQNVINAALSVLSDVEDAIVGYIEYGEFPPKRGPHELEVMLGHIRLYLESWNGC